MLDTLLPVVRLVHYVAAMQLFGAAAFATLLATPTTAAGLAAPLRALATACAILVALSALAWLAVQAGTFGDGPADALDPATLQLVLFRTQFGRVWIVVLAIAAAMLLAIAVPWRLRGRVLLALSAALLAALGLVGHLAAADSWLGFAGRASQVVHLLAAAFWIGSLVPLLLCLRRARNAGGLREAELALQRFSGLGHLAVALTLATGLFNTWMLVGGSALDLASPYQALLAGKIGLVLLMIGLALLNRYVLLPELPTAGPRATQLLRSIVGEIVVGAVVLALVSILGTLPH